MGKFDGVLLASDFDNTLVWTEDALRQGTAMPQVPERNREALRYFMANGGRFAISTGRALPAFRRFVDQVPMNAPGVVCNGAGLYDFQADRYIYTALLDDVVRDRGMEILKAFPGEILATYDPSNFVQCGVKNREAFEMLRPYVRYLHVKDSVYTGKAAVADKGFDTVTDAHRPAGLGDGELPWILGELKKMDYRGFASIEPHLSGGDFVPGTGADKFAAAANALKGLLAQI